jgi:hypothetical protein
VRRVGLLLILLGLAVVAWGALAPISVSVPGSGGGVCLPVLRAFMGTDEGTVQSDAADSYCRSRSRQHLLLAGASGTILIVGGALLLGIERRRDEARRDTLPPPS